MSREVVLVGACRTPIGTLAEPSKTSRLLNWVALLWKRS